MNSPDRDPARVASLMERILYEVKRVVVGQDQFLERVLVAMLAQGHLLVEGVPGLAKTLTVKTLAAAVRGQFRRCVPVDQPPGPVKVRKPRRFFTGRQAEFLF